MKENFVKSLEYVLQSEGGFVNDPRDPGGATNKGITQVVYDAWRLEQGLPRRTVKLINDYEIGKIYKEQYWDACHCDELPKGVDYAVFDFGVNSGVHRAKQYLQRVANVVEDEVIGPETLRAIATLTPVAIIDALCDLRIGFLQKLPTFKTFGNGWIARVSLVDKRAKEMAAA